MNQNATAQTPALVMAMATASWLLHVETFIDPDRPAAQQDSSRDALVDYLTQKTLSLSQIVKEMGEYLTTTDGAVRARGILLLGELWMQLLEQPLEDTLIHNFATFFSARLEDWHALRGALLGSLALLKREKSVGSVNVEDAKLLAESALKHLEVQALAQQDRMVCLELFECLLLQHSSAAADLGSLLADGVCLAIDGEKDPRCLLVAFHIVELVVKLFPDPKGHMGSLSEEMFSIVSCYFPISFNPAVGDKRGITREDLSTALMHCFASTRLFADFCIPLLLEKLSSSLRTAKRDSLKFLGFCSLHYGVDVLRKHAASIWMALKHELLLFQKTEAMDTRERDEEILTEALECFRACIRASQVGGQHAIEFVETDNFLQLVLQDAFLNDFLNCLPVFFVCTNHDDINSTGMSFDGSVPSDTSVVVERARVTIKETGPILAAAVKASCCSCFAVLRATLKRMFEAMKFPVHIREADVLAFLKGDMFQHSLCCTGSLMVAVLEAIGSIVEGAREVAEDYYMSFLMSNTSITDVGWMDPLQSCSTEVVMLFALVIVAGLQNGTTRESAPVEKIWEIAVAGLQAVASFPPQVPAIAENQYQFIVSFLTCLIMEKSEVKPLWDRAVGAVSAICGVEEKFSVDMLGRGLTDSLVCSLLNELLEDQKKLSIYSNLKVLATICSKRPETSSGVVKRLTALVCDNLKELVQPTDARDDTSETVVSLLQGLLQYMLPCFGSTVPESETMSELALGIWSAIENFPASYNAHNSAVLEGSMGVFRTTVSKCDEHSQRVLLLKALDRFIGASSTISDGLSAQDVWIIGLFACVMIALRPSIHIPREGEILPVLLEAAVAPSCSGVAGVVSEAVGSMLNKWHANTIKVDMMNGVNVSFTGAIDLVLKGEWIPKRFPPAHTEDGSRTSSVAEEPLQLKLRCIKLLACIGKGLAMRGEIAVSKIAMLLLRLVDCKKCSIDLQNDVFLSFLCPTDEEVSAVSFAAAEALGFILKESQTSLNKDNHAIIKLLYKQRFFVSMLPPLILASNEADKHGRVMLYCAFGNLVSGLPTSVLLTEAKKVLPLVLESLSALGREQMHSEVLLSLLLVLSALLVDKNVEELSSQHVPAIVSRLLMLICYPFSMMVRETSLLCLGAVVGLPHARVFPLRTQVLRALMDALDDPKRAVRMQAIRCCRAWDAITR